MRKDARLGEDMIKRRVDFKKSEAEKVSGPVPDEAKQFLDVNNRTYRQNRLEMADLPEGTSVSVPLIMSSAEEIAKHVL
jgi:hypothetical protein